MAQLTETALRRVQHDLVMEDCSQTAIMRASQEELIEAWESYNGEMPAEWLEEN